VPGLPEPGELNLTSNSPSLDLPVPVRPPTAWVFAVYKTVSNAALMTVIPDKG